MSAVLETQEKHAPVKFTGMKTRPISVREYDRMIEIGLFDEDERIELLNGEIIEIMPKGTRHAAFNDLVSDLLRELLGNKSIIRNQNPIILNDFSEPEPDIVVAKQPRDKYFAQHPTPEDILLILEVSDTALTYDRDVKSVFYARAGINQYLILNLIDETIEDYREPAPDGYGFKKTYRRGDAFSLVEFPEIEIKIDEILK
jgi:Uma2 family endonuclease